MCLDTIKSTMSSTSVVIVFGVFDRFHAGHQDFLRQVRECRYERIICVVAPDSIVVRFKKKQPWQTAEERIATLNRHGHEAIIGDEEPGTYSALKQIQPTGICFGADQIPLKDHITELMHQGILPFARLHVMVDTMPHLHTSVLYPG